MVTCPRQYERQANPVNDRPFREALDWPGRSLVMGCKKQHQGQAARVRVKGKANAQAVRKVNATPISPAKPVDKLSEAMPAT